MTSKHPWPRRVGDVMLRDPVASDVDVIVGFRNDPAVTRWLIVTEESPEELRRRWMGVATSESDFSCIAEVDAEVAGIGFLEIGDGMGQPGSPRMTEASIGYIVRPGFDGRGVGSAIAEGLVAAAFDGLGARRVTAGCFADNHASVRILEKAGLRREQHGRRDSWHAELGWIDGYTYAVLRDEWSTTQASATDDAPSLMPETHMGFGSDGVVAP